MAKNLSNFVSLSWKLDNPYYNNAQGKVNWPYRYGLYTMAFSKVKQRWPLKNWDVFTLFIQKPLLCIFFFAKLLCPFQWHLIVTFFCESVNCEQMTLVKFSPFNFFILNFFTNFYSEISLDYLLISPFVYFLFLKTYFSLLLNFWYWPFCCTNVL